MKSPAIERRSRATDPIRHSAGSNNPAVESNCPAMADKPSEARLKAIPYNPHNPIAAIVSPNHPARFTGVPGLCRTAIILEALTRAL